MRYISTSSLVLFGAGAEGSDICVLVRSGLVVIKGREVGSVVDVIVARSRS